MAKITAEIPWDAIEKNKTIFTEHFDDEFSRSLVESVLVPLDEVYFRSRFIGFDELPPRNNPEHPLIYASNHSGMAFPWDAIVFSAMFYRKNNFDFSKSVRALTAPMLSQSVLMNPFLIDNFWRKGGAVDATTINFETMMHYPHANLLVYPEGVPGIGKGFNHRYELQRFSTSFVRFALKYRTDIIPFSTVNGEYINPYSYHSDFLNRIVNKLGIPFLPISLLVLFLPLQPWMFYYAFPAKLTYVLGEPIKPYEMIDKPFEKITNEEIGDITYAIKIKMQNELEAAVKKYGEKPYEGKELVRRIFGNLRKAPCLLPFGWPVLFSEFERRYVKLKERPPGIKYGFLAFLRMIVMNPISIAFFLPLIGWIPILIRGLRRRS